MKGLITLEHLVNREYSAADNDHPTNLDVRFSEGNRGQSYAKELFFAHLILNNLITLMTLWGRNLVVGVPGQ